jgi:hypothetical protein
MNGESMNGEPMNGSRKGGEIYLSPSGCDRYIIPLVAQLHDSGEHKRNEVVKGWSSSIGWLL